MRIPPAAAESTTYRCLRPMTEDLFLPCPLTSETLPHFPQRHAHRYPSTVKVVDQVRTGDTRQYTKVHAAGGNRILYQFLLDKDKLSYQQFHRYPVEQEVVVQRAGPRRNLRPLSVTEPCLHHNSRTLLSPAVVQTDRAPKSRPQRKLRHRRDHPVHR